MGIEFWWYFCKIIPLSFMLNPNKQLYVRLNDNFNQPKTTALIKKANKYSKENLF